MNFEKKLPPELEQRWEKLREQLQPLEVAAPPKLVKLWKFDNQSLLAILLILFATAVLTWIWWSAGKYEQTSTEATNEITVVSNAPTLSPQTLSGEIYVYIYGEVLNPGVYSLPSGSRVFQALEIAGGQTSSRELTINLAQILNDGDQIFIGKVAEIKTDISSRQVSSQANKDKCININDANVSVLDSLPGIGPVMSKKIIDWRQMNGGFKSISELKKVKGIGDAKYREIEPLVCI